MKKSFEALREEHRQATIELGEVQQRVQNLSNSVLRRAANVTYQKALELKQKPVFHNGRVWYIEKVTRSNGYTSATGWIVEKDVIQRHTVFLHLPDQSFLAGVPFADDGTMKGLINRIAETAREIVNHYEKKADKEINSKKTKEEKK